MNKPPAELFRPEAVNHARRRLEGDVVLTSPAPLRIIGIALTVLVVICLVLAAVTSYTRRQSVTGWLVPEGGVIRVTAGQGGIVEVLNVREGQDVAAGSQIASLRLSPNLIHEDSGPALQRRLGDEQAAATVESSVAKQKLTAQRTELVSHKIAVEGQLAEAGQRLTIIEHRRALADHRIVLGEPLVQKGFLASQTLDEWRANAMSIAEEQSQLAAQIIDLKRQQADISRQITAIPNDLRDLNAQLAKNEAIFAQRRIAAQTQNASIITTPVGGRVAALPAYVGEALASGGAVALIVPHGSSLMADVFIPSRAVGFIRPGQQVRLMYEAFPHQTFGAATGAIESISATVLEPSDISSTGDAPKESVFRARVRLNRQTMRAYGREIPLQPGMKFTADVIIDRRNLIQWLLDPLYAAGRRR
jgi:membrane fusion protein